MEPMDKGVLQCWSSAELSLAEVGLSINYLNTYHLLTSYGHLLRSLFLPHIATTTLRSHFLFFSPELSVEKWRVAISVILAVNVM